MIHASHLMIDYIGFTVVAILALSAIGVGMESARILPEDLLHLSLLYNYYYNYYNLDILLMALYEQPTFYC